MVVVGGGAAGLSAALVLGRARRRVAVVDAGAPRNAPAAHMHGFLSRDGMPPADLLAARARRSPRLRRRAHRRARWSRSSRLHARLAGAARCGETTPDRDRSRRRAARIPGARERWGQDFLHCPYCHGWEVRDQPIGVLGTGPGSVDHAQLLRQWSDDVIFFPHSYALTREERAALEARGIASSRGGSSVSVVDDRLSAVQLGDGRSIPRAAVFIRPAIHPHADGLMACSAASVDEAGSSASTPPARRASPASGPPGTPQPARASDHRGRRRIGRRNRDQR